MYKAKDNKIVYYPGCFANYWDPQIGKATVHILEKNGFQVIVPKHNCCGIARVGYGSVRSACKVAERLVERLHVFVEQGYDIVTTCPSCSLAIKDDYPLLLNNEEAKVVSKKTYLITEYLIGLHERGEFNMDFKQIPLLIAYHAPCHLKAQGLDRVSTKLLSLIPRLQVIDLDRGCCGMSGTAGFKRRYYESSMIIGNLLAERIKGLNVRVVTTDCGGCKIQIEHAANVEVVHPVILLDSAVDSTGKPRAGQQV